MIGGKVILTLYHSSALLALGQSLSLFSRWRWILTRGSLMTRCVLGLLFRINNDHTPNRSVNRSQADMGVDPTSRSDHATAPLSRRTGGQEE